MGLAHAGSKCDRILVIYADTGGGNPGPQLYEI